MINVNERKDEKDLNEDLMMIEIDFDGNERSP